MRFCGEWIILFSFITALAQNGKWTVANIQFSGNNEVAREKLLEQMELQPQGLFKKSTYSFTTLADDIDAIEKYYHQNGYLSAAASIERISRNRENLKVGILIKIKEGRQTLIDTVLFTSNKVFKSSSLYSWIPVKNDDPFDSFLVDRGVYIINDSLVSRGYLFSDVKYKVRKDSINNKAEVIYQVDEGPLVKAGRLEIFGTKKVDREVVLKEVDFKTGQILTSKDITRNIGSLYNTGLFDYASIEPGDSLMGATAETLTVPVVVRVSEAQMFELMAGGGYSTSDGLYGDLSAAYKNLFGLGHGISLVSRASIDILSARLIYSYPRIFKRSYSAEITGYLQRIDAPTFSGAFGGGILSLIRRAGKCNRYRAYMQAERTSWIDEPEGIDTFTTDQPENIFLLGAGLSRDTRRSVFIPGKAIFAYLDAEIAGFGIIPWSSNFYRLNGDIRFYVPFFRSISLSTALYSGYLHGFAGDQVPIQKQFYFGPDGIRVIRGYSERELAIISESGDTLGGNFAMVVTPIEITFPITGILRGALFVEGGGIWERPRNFGLATFHWSLGPGVRIGTPIGPVRLDYGFQLNREFPFRGGFSLGIGLAF